MASFRLLLGVALAVSAQAFSVPPVLTRMSPLASFSARSSALRTAGLRGTAIMATPIVGEPAPPFDLPSDSGKNLSLKSLRGKWVVVYFYPKVFTQGCTCQAEAYQKDVEDFRSKNCEVVGISTNPMEKIKDFKLKYGLSFPMLADRECTVVESYGVAMKLPFVGTFANRFSYIIDPQGQLRARFGNVDPKMDSIVCYARLLELQNPK